MDDDFNYDFGDDEETSNGTEGESGAVEAPASTDVSTVEEAAGWGFTEEVKKEELPQSEGVGNETEAVDVNSHPASWVATGRTGQGGRDNKDNVEDYFGEEEGNGAVDNGIESRLPETETVIDIPLSNIQELFAVEGSVYITVHNVSLAFNASQLRNLGINADIQNSKSRQVFAKAIEEKLSPEDAFVLRQKQLKALSVGARFSIADGEAVKDTQAFKVIIPELVSRVRVEVSDKEIPEDELHYLNSVKEEYRGRARGLNRVLKNTSAAEVLNAVQEFARDGELDFYFKVLLKMPADSNTRSFVLMQLRMMMQYALNVDNLELKAALTEVLL